MAKAKKTEADNDLAALRERVEAILHSNGFEGTKTAGEITEVVGAFVGGDLSAPKEAETTGE